MTYEALMHAIRTLMIKRKQAHGNQTEQDRINAKLDKLYEKRKLILGV